MSRPILLSASQLRIDGRRALELRPMTCTFDQSPSSDGSAALTQGLCSVVATVHGPRDGRSSSAATRPPVDEAGLNVAVQFAPFSSSDRRKRSKGDRKVTELAAALKNTFEPAIMLSLYPRSSIDLSLLVLNTDGSLLSTAINACTLALVHAGIALSSPVSSVSLSVLHDTALLDPSAPEENELPTVSVACMAPLAGQDSGKVTLVGLEARLAVDRFEALLRLGAQACAVVSQELERVSKNYTQKSLSQLSGSSLSAALTTTTIPNVDDQEEDL